MCILKQLSNQNTVIAWHHGGSGNWFSKIPDWLQERLISEMIYDALMGMLNPTHSLTHSLTQIPIAQSQKNQTKKNN